MPISIKNVCRQEDRKNLLERLEAGGMFRNKLVKAAFEAIDRADFVRQDYLPEAYEDYPLPIGEGQTISQPTTIAFMLEKLDVKKGDSVLDVGSGSGYTTALLAHIVGDGGKVVGVELLKGLVEFGKKNLSKYNFKYASIRQARKGAFGVPEEAPYDRILVSAAADKLPEELMEQLKKDGVMVVPLGDSICRVTGRTEGGIDRQCWRGFIFVPLMAA